MLENYTFFDENQQLQTRYIETEIDEDPYEPYRILQWLFIKESGALAIEEVIQLAGDISAKSRRNRTQFIGIKCVEGWYELYFYLFDAKGFERSARAVLSECNINTYELGATKEKQMRFYYESLMPDAWELTQVQSKAIFDELLDAGDDLSLLHQVEFYLRFATRSLAEKASELLETFNEHNLHEHEKGFALVCTHEHPLTENADYEKELFDVATQFHGTYSGWSTKMAAL